jgi:hypothetical protein
MNNDNIRYRYPLDLQLFAEDLTPEPDPEPTPTPEPKLVPQDEVDRIVAERLARERKKFGDYDDIKAKLTALEEAETEREKAKLSETERLEAEKAAAIQAAEDAKAERDKALTAANQRLINAEFKTLARENNVPADRLSAALKLADLDSVTVDEDGNAQGVEDAVKALIEAHPYLAEKTQPKQIGGASGGSDLTDKTKEQLLAEAKLKAEKNPTPDAIAAYTKLKRELS